MDYKELIELLCRTVEHGNEEPREYCTNMCGGCEMCDQAADAIKTLLAERDAAVTLMHGECYACKNKETKFSDEPCSLCKWGAMRCMVPVAKLQDSWEWRGPQREDK